MKTIRICKAVVCFLTLFLLSIAFAAQAQEQAAIEAISSDIATLSNEMMDDVQTTTATLEGTSWDVEVLNVITLQKSPAILTFSNGMLTISNWIIQLNPGAYDEAIVKRNIISFTATLEKPGIVQKQIFEVQGGAIVGKVIAGVLHNLTTNMYYVFGGKPSAQ
jgi:hypothetical protein